MKHTEEVWNNSPNHSGKKSGKTKLGLNDWQTETLASPLPPPSGFIDKGTLDGVYEFKKVKNRMLFSNMY